MSASMSLERFQMKRFPSRTHVVIDVQEYRVVWEGQQAHDATYLASLFNTIREVHLASNH